MLNECGMNDINQNLRTFQLSFQLLKTLEVR